MTFDAENRTATFNGGSGTTTYTYDGEGRRVKKVDNAGVTSVYVYNAQGQLAAEYSTQASTVAGGTSYLLADHLGSTRVMTHPDGTIRGRHDYLPFGEEIGTSIGGRSSIPGYGAVDIRQKFTAKERDTESGLDFFSFRYYSGAQGRFTSPDPMMASGRVEDPQSWNRYAYARNNPLRFVDPLGLYASPAYNCSEQNQACLNDEQRRILENSRVKIDGKTYSGEELYNKLSEQQQNSFVNQTDALASITFADGRTGISYVQSVTSIEGDRIKAVVESGLDKQLAGDSRFAKEDASLHAPYNDISYKSKDARGNIQFSFDKSRTGADIDHDLYRNKILHFFGEVVPNHAGQLFGNKNSVTNQDEVRRLLIANPKVGITPSPDPKFNRKGAKP